MAYMQYIDGKKSKGHERTGRTERTERRNGIFRPFCQLLPPCILILRPRAMENRGFPSCAPCRAAELTIVWTCFHNVLVCQWLLILP